MIPGAMDPKKMQAMMKQMGIQSDDIPATSVVIETESEKMTILNPQVVKITMQGQESFQITGSVQVEEKTSSEDLKMVMEQAGCSEEEARSALEQTNGDIAEAILLMADGKE
ncbi:MAG: nascent polypeptide-associated complex protein [Candidatus Micrarchaeota archaeon]